MVMDDSYTCVEPSIMHKLVKPLPCTPETNTQLKNYTQLKKKKKRKEKVKIQGSNGNQKKRNQVKGMAERKECTGKKVSEKAQMLECCWNPTKDIS